MAVKHITIKLSIHWFDKYFYLPFLKMLALMGFKFDVNQALKPMTKRVKTKVVK